MFGLTAAAKLLLEGSSVFRGHHHADLKPCDAPHQEEYNIIQLIPLERYVFTVSV